MTLATLSTAGCPMVTRLRATACDHVAGAIVVGKSADAAARLYVRRRLARALYAWHLARIHQRREVTLPARVWEYLASPEL